MRHSSQQSSGRYLDFYIEGKGFRFAFKKIKAKDPSGLMPNQAILRERMV